MYLQMVTLAAYVENELDGRGSREPSGKTPPCRWETIADLRGAVAVGEGGNQQSVLCFSDGSAREHLTEWEELTSLKRERFTLQKTEKVGPRKGRGEHGADSGRFAHQVTGRKGAFPRKGQRLDEAPVRLGGGMRDLEWEKGGKWGENGKRGCVLKCG